MASTLLPEKSTPARAAPLMGAFYMILAAAGFAAMNGMVRHVSAELHPFEIAFFRNFLALLLMIPWVLAAGRPTWTTTHPRLHFWRALIGVAAMLAWFSSITLLPLAQAVALNFTTPLFATIGAVIFLGEVVRLRRWTATVVGFIGVLVIIRPFDAEISLVTALPVVAAVAMAGSILVVKTLSGLEKPITIVFYMTLLMTPLSLAPAVAVWETPSLAAYGWMGAIALVANAAHIALVRSYAHADASAVLPFDYTRLPFTALLAYLAFGEVPDVWTWVGGAIIAGSTFYIAHREAVGARERRPAGHAPKALP